MKKLFVLVVMTVAMVFFASCGNNAQKNAEATEETKSECCSENDSTKECCGNCQDSTKSCCSDSTKACTGECGDSTKCAGCEKHEEAK